MTETASIESLVQNQARADIRIARFFVDAARRGDTAEFRSLGSVLDDQTLRGWHHALVGISGLASVSTNIRSAFLEIWVENKSLSIHIDNRRLLVKALRVLFPCDYDGPPLSLFRGTRRFERRRRRYGFSWTTKIEVARSFADEHSAKVKEATAVGLTHFDYPGNEGIILEAVAPAAAIMLMREGENYYDEGEVVVDPFGLGKISTL